MIIVSHNEAFLEKIKINRHSFIKTNEKFKIGIRIQNKRGSFRIKFIYRVRVIRNKILTKSLNNSSLEIDLISSLISEAKDIIYSQRRKCLIRKKENGKKDLYLK